MKSPNCADHILTDQSAEVDTNNLSFTAILVTEALWPFRVWRYSPLTMSHFLIVWSAEAVKRTRCDMSTARLKTPPLCPKHRYHWVNSLLTAVTVATVTIFYLRFCGSVFERLFHKLLVCWHNVIVCFLLRCTYVTGVKYVRRGKYLKMFWDKCPTWLPKALPSNRNCRWQDSLVSRCTYHWSKNFVARSRPDHQKRFESKWHCVCGPRSAWVDCPFAKRKVPLSICGLPHRYFPKRQN